MKIRLGTTRLVVLTSKYAIKIARVRPIRCFFRILTFPFTSSANHNRFYKKYGAKFHTAILRYVIFGVYANRLEFSFYQEHRNDTRIVPTLKSFCLGFIIIQLRGADVSPEKLKLCNPFKNIATERYHEVTDHKQFCEINDAVLLVDYGHKETCSLLARTTF